MGHAASSHFGAVDSRTEMRFRAGKLDSDYKGYTVCGMVVGPVAAYIRSMQLLRARVSLYVVLLMGIPVEASVTTLGRPGAVTSSKVASNDSAGDTQTMRESLRNDVAKHPGEFVVFATEAGAERFIAEHRADVEREPNSRIVARGVVGFWQGKILVVLPLEPLKSSR